MRSCSDIVFKYKMLVHSPEQVIHRYRWLLCDGLKKWHARADASFEDLQDDIYIVRFNLEHCLPESLHEVP